MSAAQSRQPAATAQVAQKNSLEQRLHSLQLGLSADAIRDTALSSPVWAAIMAGLFGGILPDLGNTPISTSWPWIAACAIVGAAVLVLWRLVKTRAILGTLQRPMWRLLVASAYF